MVQPAKTAFEAVKEIVTTNPKGVQIPTEELQRLVKRRYGLTLRLSTAKGYKYMVHRGETPKDKRYKKVMHKVDSANGKMEKEKHPAATVVSETPAPALTLDLLDRVKRFAADRFGGVRQMRESLEGVRQLAQDIGGAETLTRLLNILE